MNTINLEVNGNFEQIQKIIDLIKAIENGNISYQGITTTSPVIKASVMLALYNIIEATTTKLLNKIHNEIIQSKTPYKKLSIEIKNLVILYYHYHKNKGNNIHDSLNVIHDTIDMIINKDSFNLTYNEMSEVYQLYSGNLDAREIRKIFKKYGIIIAENIGANLRTIKKVRNILAHGEQAFEDHGRTIVLNSLESHFSDTKNFLMEVIKSVSKYLDQKQYREQPAKPPQKRRKK
ncbi:MAE_28990/MAE_18760 family HEPN-like nuclease [Providencia hangzhouensis]|uniref:MAE_28990/MAE_18760 family HEPN-like nuclease n=1 Tax=Providencia hangzhouensis TaxID=3031799 RepID=UPI0034DD1EE5